MGLFDSGVGGLTVVRALRRELPSQRILYLADQAHVPYGDRPAEEIRRFALAITQFLISVGSRAVVMACNISSATALETARARHRPTPVIGVIEAAVRAALEVPHFGTPRIGVLATRGTVASGAYPRLLHQLCPEAVVTQVPCPDLVPLIESGALNGATVQARCRHYLRPLAEAGCTTIILGCTHYPLLLPVFEEEAHSIFENEPVFVDPAQAMVDELRQMTELDQSSPTGEMRLLTTGDPEILESQVRRLLGITGAVVGKAQWEAGKVRIVFPVDAASQHDGAASAAGVPGGIADG